MAPFWADSECDLPRDLPLFAQHTPSLGLEELIRTQEWGKTKSTC